MIRHDSCPLCSSVEIRQLFEVTDHFLSGEHFPVARCLSCGFTFTREYPEEDSIGAYYESEEYISHSGTSRGIVNKIYHLARHFMLSRKKRMVEKNTGSVKGSLLDVGSGAGSFAAVMKEAGWSVKGVEINAAARNSSIETYGLEVIGPDQLPNLEKHSFDCITLWHVLEHFHDPRVYLGRLRELLKPGGTMIIAVPNIVSADAVYYGSYWAALDVPRHLWHFSPATLQLLAGKTGFTVTGRRILPLDVFYIGILSEKYRGRSFSFFRAVLKAKWFTLKTVFNRARASSLVYFLRKDNDQ